ncbi:MAG: class I SAM-dependent methyltransferase [candidate division Zixibacteria bacterium]|nr:class I SAM-dependent methyltransferase [candidate division Zixibacteria bacterium]
MKKASFFDKYAQEYDWLTDATRREESHRREVTAIIEKCHPLSVLDAGCATGLTTRLFAAAGINTVGIYRSRRMIKLARENTLNSHHPLSFRYGEFEYLPRILYNKFDLVVCLANAITGVNSLSGLRKSLKNFKAVLKPGGTLLIQMLNYLAVREGVLMPVRTTVHEGLIYIRFTERKGRRHSLYIIRLDLDRKPVQMEPFRSDFDNFTVDEMETTLKTTGFSKIKKYADLFLERRFTPSSRDLVITAWKAPH